MHNGIHVKYPFFLLGFNEIWMFSIHLEKYSNVKCTLVQPLRLCTGRTAHRGSRGIAQPFLDHGSRRGWGVSVTPRPLFTPRKDPTPILQEVGWAPGQVWTRAENLAPTGIRSSDRPDRSQSLYRLRYPAHNSNVKLHENPSRGSRAVPCDQTGDGRADRQTWRR